MIEIERERGRDKHSSRSSSKRHGDPYRDKDRGMDRTYRERDMEYEERDRSRSASVSSRRSHYREGVDIRDRRYVISRSRSPPPTHMEPPPPFSHFSPIKESKRDRGGPYGGESRHGLLQQPIRQGERDNERLASVSDRNSSTGRAAERGFDRRHREYVPPMVSPSIETAKKRQSSSSSSQANMRIHTFPEGAEPLYGSKSPISRSSGSKVEMGRKSLGLRRVDSGSSGSHEQASSQLQQQFSTPR